MVTTAIIPAAGLGTRLLPLSKAIPKEMLPVVDRPLIQHVVDEAVQAGIQRIILVTRSGKSALEDHFDQNAELEASLQQQGKTELLQVLQQILPSGVSLCSVRQPQAGGLGQAVLCAAPLIDTDEPFVVLLPDVLVKSQSTEQGHALDLLRMIQAGEQDGAAQIMVAGVPLDKVDQYGIVDCQGSDPRPGQSAALKDIVEKPSPAESPGQLSVIGRYLLPGRIMSVLAETPADHRGEVQLTDAIATLIRQGASVQAYHMTGRTFDCGSVTGWLTANVTLGREQGLLPVGNKS